jgi:hypothetical protein
MTLQYLSADALTSAGIPYFSVKSNCADSGSKRTNMDMGKLAEGQDIHIFYSPIAGCYYSGVVLKHENLISVIMSTAGQAELYYFGSIPDDVRHKITKMKHSFVEGPSANSSAYAVCSVPKGQDDWSNSLAEVESLIDSIEHGEAFFRSSSIMDLASKVSRQASQGIVDIEAWATGLAQDIVNADD